MNDNRKAMVAAATLALALVSAVGLAATGPAVEDHVALSAVAATDQLLP